MKTTIKSISFVFFFVLLFNANAHYLWLETSQSNVVGAWHEVKVKYGEYTYGLTEKTNGDNFAKVDNFTVWVMSPTGKKETLKFEQTEEAYIGKFKAKESGTYTVSLDNNDIEVIDYTKYDFGIFKTHYHSIAKVQIGNDLAAASATNTNTTGLSIVDLTTDSKKLNSEVSLQILYKDAPLEEEEITVFVKDFWSKKIKTDAEGKVTFSLPWDTTYIIEVTKKEEVPGEFKGKTYEFIWHCVTTCFILD